MNKKSNAFIYATGGMNSTVRNGPSQTFLNLGFNDDKGIASNKNDRSTRYSKPFEETTTV